MKKAIIPMAIAAIFGLTGIIVYSTGTYVPETITLEGDGGTDEKVENLDGAVGAFSVAALQRGSAYYQSLMAMEKDPEPLKEGNSIGVNCEGSYSSDSLKTSYERKLIIAQNEKGLNYHYAGWQIVSGMKTTLDYLVAVNRHGMFVKYNSHAIEPQEKDLKVEDLQLDLSKAMNSNRGKWFSVTVTDEHMKEAQDYSNPVRAMMIGICASVAQEYQAQFLNVVDTNNKQITELGQIIDAEKAKAEKSGNVYKISSADLNATVNLASPTAPVVTLQSIASAKDKQHQDITLQHINNTKVNIIENGQGDFVDLFGEAITNYINKGMK